MFNSETLEIAIGMSFLFLLMALTCTAIKEWIEGVLKWRAMDLERALRTLLDDPDGSTTAFLFRHPQIFSLFQGKYDPSTLTSSMLTPGAGAMHMPLRHRRNLPSYIPSSHFSIAFLDLIGRGPTVGTQDDEQGNIARPLTVAELRQRAMLLDSAHVRRVVLNAIDYGGGDLNKVKLNVEQWFDGTMDRAAGWYKRRTQAVLFMIGLAAAVVLNVDALNVLHRLTTDKTFREVVVKEAESAKPPSTSSKELTDNVVALRKEVDRLGLPMGWKPIGDSTLAWAPTQLCATRSVDEPCDFRARHDAILRVLLGWLITALGVMLGAPFWFDVLNRIMVIRSTVKPHEKSPEEGSQDNGGGPAPVPPGPSAPPSPAAPPAPTDGTENRELPLPSPEPATGAVDESVFEPRAWKPAFVNKGEIQP
ncbi:hypothetical protein QTH97_04290 [Variovorax sp. J22R24]|uniref:hypothetical protein n=1 Tax=Variovorax gracilis TaxID=3053502 RepID=UPI00257886C7|nr:hypothetical protein [Variovorax sp. J22R24]MDM0104138.1 hypothetical protein [Variovorax sp. J22R24]